jgi:16S rRNA (cytosine1402-N4)-methyltransferase
MHFPVLQKEVLKYLDPKPNGNFIDATIGQGGHGLAILEKILPEGKLLGIDWSPELIQELKVKTQNSKVKSNLILVCDNFVNLKEIVKRKNFKNISGVLFDLGLSSWHLEESGRGFSFQRDEPLDMRYNQKLEILTAEKIINEWPEAKLERIFREYGEERFAKRIVKKIVEVRKIQPIKTTFQLIEIIKKATPNWYHWRRIHFATRTFQALRIAVNEELKNLEKILPQALEILKSGGRLVVISFHSLEDRIVKNFLKKNHLKLKILTKKPISPSREEIKQNPRSRSAKLRAAIKL